jgi:hypothetical protein
MTGGVTRPPLSLAQRTTSRGLGQGAALSLRLEEASVSRSLGDTLGVRPRQAPSERRRECRVDPKAGAGDRPFRRRREYVGEMRYVIAGGGAYGAHYVQKLLEAIRLERIELDEIVVVDRDPGCRAAAIAEAQPIVRLELSEWRQFPAQVWADPSSWVEDIWIPAPIAPHILADWVTDRVGELTGLETIAERTPVRLPDLPFAQQHPDGRILLSHAPGRCPLDCIEPGTCAITKDTRWWEMRDTLAELIAGDDLELELDCVAMFFCRHHCDPSQHDVGGIPFSTICIETERVCERARHGADQIGVATFSSCHGVLTRLAVKQPAEPNTPDRRARQVIGSSS